jgi:hypothetical protein
MPVYLITRILFLLKNTSSMVYYLEIIKKWLGTGSQPDNNLSKYTYAKCSNSLVFLYFNKTTRHFPVVANKTLFSDFQSLLLILPLLVSITYILMQTAVHYHEE